MYTYRDTTNVLNTVTTSTPVNSYTNNDATATMELTRKYRYCIQVLHKYENNGGDNWLRVGVSQPDGVTLYPLDGHSEQLGRIFSAPDDSFSYAQVGYTGSARFIFVRILSEVLTLKVECADIGWHIFHKFYWYQEFS